MYMYHTQTLKKEPMIIETGSYIIHGIRLFSVDPHNAIETFFQYGFKTDSIRWIRTGSQPDLKGCLVTNYI